jgi:adenylate cyclase, class 2
MARETEIKVKIYDLPALHAALQRMGALPLAQGSPRVHEENIVFDTPQSTLAGRDQLLRVRTETPVAPGESRRNGSKPRVILTFKRPIDWPQDGSAAVPPGLYKVREEIEVELTDAANLIRIIEGLGMTGWFRYEKYRTTYRLPDSEAWAAGLLIELDETPIGTFVELEGPATSIDRAAEALGFSKQDYVLTNYLGLYLEDCRRKGEKPSNMVFAESQPRTRGTLS